MVCGSCGTKIAEKAIVCYRCGQATAIPVVARPPRVTPVSTGRPWSLILLCVSVAGVVAWVLPDRTADPTWRVVEYAAAATFLALAVFFTLRRPGPRP